MKKFLPLLLAALLAFGLCGCAGSNAPDEPEATQVVEEPDYVPAFSDAESAAMASFMNKNRALIYESALYTFDFDGEYRPVTACRSSCWRWTGDCITSIPAAAAR